MQAILKFRAHTKKRHPAGNKTDRLVGHGLQVFGGQRRRIQIMRGRPLHVVSVVLQKPMGFLVGQRFPLQPDGPEPSPGQGGRILHPLQKIPAADPLLIRHLAHKRINSGAKPETGTVPTCSPCFLSMLSKLILFPLLSVRQPMDSTAITSDTILGSGRSCRMCCKDAFCFSPTSFFSFFIRFWYIFLPSSCKKQYLFDSLQQAESPIQDNSYHSL